MNILQLEQERILLNDKLTEGFSNQAKLLFIYNFFEKTLSTKNDNLIESYLPEFIPEYIRCLKSWTVFGMKPRTCVAGRQVHELLIEQLEKIEKSELKSGIEEIAEIITRLKNELKTLLLILNGLQEKVIESKAYFPLLEEEAIKETGMTIGVIESVTIKIHKARSGNKFIIVPSEKEIEEKISEQVKQSWFNAIKVAKKYIRKIHPYHEVIISFDKKAGFCKGNSLGTALTLSFVEEILKTYNSPVVIKVGDGIAFTGGVDELGKITKTSVEIIKQKTELVFFSDVTHFAVPKAEEAEAIEKLNELKREYPNRDLKITGVEDLYDLLNRRNLVEIKKINPAVRSAKFARKNWAAFSLMLIIAVMFYFAGWWDFDTNPKVIKYENQHLNIYNVNKKLLWNEKLERVGVDFLDGDVIKDNIIILNDIDGDGTNEVILTRFILERKSKTTDQNGILCLDKNKKVIWQYRFDEPVSSKNINSSTEYLIYLLGVSEQGNKKILYAIARNEYFPSAVFGIDIKSGERVTDIFWHSGHLADGFVFKDDSTGKEKIFLAGINNGFECVAAMVLDLENLSGQAIAPENYVLKNIPPANMEKYILIPKSDVAEYYGNRYNAVPAGNVIYYPKDKLLSLKTSEAIRDGELSGDIQYFFNLNLSINLIETGDAFQLERDKLVKEGKLSPPLTYTPEYFTILRNNIKYWDGVKFIDAKKRAALSGSEK